MLFAGLTEMNRAVVILATILTLLSVVVHSQNNKPPKPLAEVFTVEGFRTEGGLANLVEGHVTRAREGKITALATRNFIADGDGLEVTTGHVELLLNPGTYLRLSSDTQVAFIDLSPDNIKLRLLRGSLILETLVSQFEFQASSQSGVRGKFNSSYQGISVLTTDGEFVTTRGGVYRCDIDEDGRSRLKVVKGVAVASGNVITSGLTLPLGDRVPTIEKFDRKREDSFDAWSHQRASALVQMNKSLRDTEWHHQLHKNPRTYVTITYDESSERLKERMVVSALGGYVGYAEKGATYQTLGSSWQPLTKDVELKFGDHIRTGPDARAEIRLYPSCYLTISINTEVVYGSRPDGGTAIEVLHGSAIMASSVPRTDGLVTSFNAGEAEVEIPGKGFYRLNVSPRLSELLVYEGKVSIAGQVVEADHRAELLGRNIDVGAIRRRDLDAFELWSRKRSSVLFEEPNRYKHIAVSTPNAHRAQRFGLWCLVRDSSSYTFVPAMLGLESPYGGTYEIGFQGRVR
jgi:hypothetical protein